jgi:hypothetical protein
MLLVKHLENQGCNRKGSCDEQKSDKTLVVSWGVNLLPDDQGQPSLDNRSQQIGASNNDGTFFIVIGCQFLCPANLIRK